MTASGDESARHPDTGEYPAASEQQQSEEHQQSEEQQGSGEQPESEEQQGSGAQATLPDRIANAVQDHPSVVRLHEGPFGVIASHLPGRKVIGVSAQDLDSPVEVSVVLRLREPFPQVAAELRERVRQLVGDVPVNVTVSDIAIGDELTEGSR